MPRYQALPPRQLSAGDATGDACLVFGLVLPSCHVSSTPTPSQFEHVSDKGVGGFARFTYHPDVRTRSPQFCLVLS